MTCFFANCRHIKPLSKFGQTEKALCGFVHVLSDDILIGGTLHGGRK